MRRLGMRGGALFCLAFAFCLAGQPAALARVITDMAGRKVTVPDQIKKVYCTSALGVIALYSVAPDRLLGWNSKLSKEEAEYIPEPYRSLPVVGGWFGENGVSSLEQVAKNKPDIILSMGDTDATAVSMSEKLEKQTGIPMVMATGRLLELDKGYEFLGELLGVQAEAKKYSAYCRDEIAELRARLKTLPPGPRPRVYYGEGSKGLDTIAKGSYHAELLDFLDVDNVAHTSSTMRSGRVSISLEQLIVWDPEYIVMGYNMRSSQKSFYETIKDDSAWSKIKAVKNGRVVESPQYPINWFGRPPSVNRLMGLRWLAHLFYPKTFPYDMTAETKKFYKMFYHCDLTDAQAARLLARATPKQ